MREETMAAADYLPQLNEAVAQLLTRRAIHDLIEALKQKLKHTAEPFVWSSIARDSITVSLPERIKSVWIFVLKRDVPSGCHYHPNSIQHMVMTEGEGTSKIANTSRQMKTFDAPGSSLEDIWYIIPEGVPHEFFPRESDMVVISFHTCTSDELQEVSCETGARREYESEV